MALDPRARFKITADNSDYKRKIKQAKRANETFAKSVSTTLKRGAVAGTAAITATAFAFTRLARQAAIAADALAKQSDILGISTQKMAAYQLAARLSGSTNEGFEKGMRKVQKAIVDAEAGLTTYTRAFEKLRLDPAELKQLTPDQQFDALGKAFAGVESQVDRVAIAYDLFGGKNTALLNTLVLTGTEMQKLEADTKAWGVALTRVDAKQIENANDAVERSKTAFQGIGTSIALAIAPLRENFANAFADAAAEADGFKSQIQSTMEALVRGANFAANAVHGIELAFLGTQLAALKIKESFADLTKKRSFTIMGGLREVSGENSPLNQIRADMDKTGAAIDALVAKFQSGDQAAARFVQSQAESDRRAQAAIAAAAPAGGTETGSPFEIFGDKEREQLAARLKGVQDALLSETEAIRQSQLERAAIVQEAFDRDIINEVARDEIRGQLAAEATDRLLAIEQKAADARAKIEKNLQQKITQYRDAAVQNGIALLHQFGARSRAFAAAAIIFEKAVAIQKILISSKIAAAAALQPPPIGLGPLAGPALAAKILAGGALNAASVAALGVAQIANLGSGSTGTTLGTPTNPIFTESVNAQQVAPPRNVTHVHIGGSLLSGQDTLDSLKGWIRELTDADEVIFSSESRQAAEVRGG